MLRALHLRDFVLVDSGEHANTLDLKAGGIIPIVQMARLFALSKGHRRRRINLADRLSRSRNQAR